MPTIPVPKTKASEMLALKGIAEAFKPHNWVPTKIIERAGENPKGVGLILNQMALATAVWLQVVTSVLNPILMYFQYKNDTNISPHERKMLISQETAKQAVHLTLHVAVMIFGVQIAKKAITKKAMSLIAQDAKLAEKLLVTNDKGHKVIDDQVVGPYFTAISNVAGCFAGAILLPILGATLFKKLDQKLGLTESHSPDHQEEPGEKAAKVLKQKQQLNQVSEAPQSPVTPMVHPNHAVHLNGAPGAPNTTVAPSFGQRKQIAYNSSPFAYQPLSLAR